jgi:VWFA-related protein
VRAKTILSGLAAAALLNGALVAQGPTDDEIRVRSGPYVPEPVGAIRVETTLVEVVVVVRDARGAPVRGLTAADFQIFDNGRQQKIAAFSVEAAGAPARALEPPPATSSSPAESAAPPFRTARLRYVALFFDDINMSAADVAAARAAAEKFVRENLEPADRVGVFTSSNTVTLGFTANVNQLLTTLAVLRTNQRVTERVAMACPPISHLQAYMIINLHDRQALDAAVAQGVANRCFDGPNHGAYVATRMRAEEVLALSDQFARESLRMIENVVLALSKMEGRRTLVLVSAGFLTRNALVNRRQTRLVDAALRAGVVINSLDSKGLAAFWPGGDPEAGPAVVLGLRPDLMAYLQSLASDEAYARQDPMALLAEGTGGRFFRNSNDLDCGLREMAAPPEVLYLLGFIPERVKPDGSFHALKVKLARAGNFTLSARRGYFAPTKASLAPTLSEKLDAAVMGNDEAAAIPAEVSTQALAPAPDELPGLKISLRLDARRLPFQRAGDRRRNRVRFVAALFDGEGKFLAGAEGDAALAVRNSTRDWLEKNGLTVQFSLHAPAGRYRLRVVAQELVAGRLSAFSRPVEIQ